MAQKINIFEGLAAVALIAGLRTEALLAPHDPDVPDHVLRAAFSFGVIRCGVSPFAMCAVLGIQPEFVRDLAAVRGNARLCTRNFETGRLA